MSSPPEDNVHDHLERYNNVSEVDPSVVCFVGFALLCALCAKRFTDPSISPF
jgi:hypothetical protein